MDTKPRRAAFLAEPTFRYGILIGWYWLTFNTMLNFSTMLFNSYGMTSYEVGLASACTSVANVVAQPIWGLVCDRMPRIRRVYCIGLIGAMAAVLLRYADTGNKWLLVASTCLVYFCFMPLSSMQDAWINRMNANGMAIRYPVARSFGSMGGVVGSLVFGILADRFGVVIMAPTFLLFAAVLILYVHTLTEPRAVIAEKTARAGRQEDSFRYVLRQLLVNRQYLILLFAYTLSSAGLNALHTFLSVKITRLGGGFAQFGTMSAITASCEIVFLMLFPKIRRRVRPQGIMAIGFFFTLVRILCVSRAATIPQIFLIALLHGPSGGILIGGAVAYLSEVVDRKVLFTAQTCMAAMLGIGSIAGNYVGGLLTVRFPLDTVILLLGILPLTAFAAMGCNFLRLHRADKRRDAPGPDGPGRDDPRN